MLTVYDRLLLKFKDLNIPVEYIDMWHSEANALHGSTLDILDELAIESLACSIGCKNIAMNSAHFYKYTLDNEIIDKDSLTEKYLKLASYYEDEYNQRLIAIRNRNGEVSMCVQVGRADR